MPADLVPAAAKSVPRGSEFPVVQGLRGIASLLVCLFHLGNGRDVFPLLYFWITNGGELGIDIFFVLSGFIVPYSMARARYSIADFPRFLLKRVARIDPPYLATIALIVPLDYLSTLSPLYSGQPWAFDPQQLLLHAGYLIPFFPGKLWLSPVFWTLAIEFQYYLLLALLFPLLFSSKSTLRSAGMLLLLALTVPSSPRRFVFAQLALFLAGIFLCQLNVRKLARYEFAAYPTAILAALLFRSGWGAALIAVAVCLMIGFVKTCPAALAFLGDISYSLYLLHWPIGTRWMNLGNRFAHKQWQFDLLLLSGVAVCLACAWLMYRFVELPAKRWASRIQYKSQQPALIRS